MQLDRFSSKNKFNACLLISLIGIFAVTYECIIFYFFRNHSLQNSPFAFLGNQIKLPVINGVTEFTGAANSTLGVSQLENTRAKNTPLTLVVVRGNLCGLS